ncbi:MAG: diacylglycerol kinase family protein [Pseudomonadales bacterium]
MRVVIISNATAARARRHVPALQQVFPESASVSHSVTQDTAQLARLVGHDTWQPTDLLVINGGDGSVQHVLSELLSHCPPPRLPRVACLPGGTTNMTAFDINRHRDFDRCLDTLQRVETDLQSLVAARPVVRVAERGAARAHYGLFFGTGSIVQGIEYFHQRVRPSGGGHELGAGVALARALWGIVRQQPPFAEPLLVGVRAPGLAPSPADSDSDSDSDSDWSTVSVRVLLVTALNRLFLGLRPYWSTHPGQLKATLVESQARRFLTSTPRLLRGRPNRFMTPEHGYHSRGLEQLSLRFHGSYTLDGELFALAGDTITVESSVPIRFIAL